jgi:hypothetical protein
VRCGRTDGWRCRPRSRGIHATAVGLGLLLIRLNSRTRPPMISISCKRLTEWASLLGRGGGEWRHGVSSSSCLSLSRDPGILHDEYRHYRETDDQISTSNLKKKNILRVLVRAPAGGTRTAYRRPFLPAAPAAEGRHMAGPAPLQLATAPRAVVSTACTLDCPRLALCRTGRLLAPTVQ